MREKEIERLEDAKMEVKVHKDHQEMQWALEQEQLKKEEKKQLQEMVQQDLIDRRILNAQEKQLENMNKRLKSLQGYEIG